MTPETYIKVCLALGVAWVFWYYCWKEMALDILRQSLFRTRDELFSRAAEGKDGLSFDDPSYRRFRLRINELIRAGYTTTFLSIALFWCGLRWGRLAASAGYKTLREDTLAHHAAMKDISDRVSRAVIRYLAMTSPLFLGFIVLVTAYVLIRFGVIKPVMKKLQEFVLKGVEPRFSFARACPAS